MYVCMYVCMYIYIDIHTYMYWYGKRLSFPIDFPQFTNSLIVRCFFLHRKTLGQAPLAAGSAVEMVQCETVWVGRPSSGASQRSFRPRRCHTLRLVSRENMRVLSHDIFWVLYFQAKPIVNPQILKIRKAP